MDKTRLQKQQGNTVVEFALVAVFLIPLLLGTVNVGMNLTRSIQVTQISRDAGHMFARFVDFAQVSNQEIIVRLAYGLGMTRNSGNGRVTLSRIMMIGEDECAAGGVDVADCTNLNQSVFTQQIVVGNQSLRDSNFGEPPADWLDDKGEIDADQYLTDVRARSSGFATLLPLQGGEFAYVSEAYFQSPEYDFPGFFEGTEVYGRTIF